MMANLIQRQTAFLIKRFIANNHRLQTIKNFHTSPNLARIVSFNLSDIGEGIREVTVKEWFVKEGDVVEQFDNLCEVQSDKASVTITSRYDGKIVKLHKDIDEIALVGKPLLDFDVDDEEKKDDDEDSSSSDEEEEDELQVVEAFVAGGLGSKSKVLATPAVRKLAIDHKLDLNLVEGSGRHGRVLKGDVLEYLNLIPKGSVKPDVYQPQTLASKVVQHKQPIAPVEGEVKSPPVSVADKVVPLKGIANVMYKSMTESLKIPHFAYSDEIDLSNLVKVREELKQEALARGIKLTYMPFFVKSASQALKEFPILNSSFDEPNMSIIYKSNHNISIAMQTAQGLVVPNVKNVQNKNILEIAEELNALQAKGKKGILAPDDFSHGTFSLSNIGMVGGTYTHPCIMPPQVAIGAIGKTKVLPRFDSAGNLIKAHIMNVSWSADHRIIDGVTMASFSNLWKKYLEYPNLLLLSTK